MRINNSYVVKEISSDKVSITRKEPLEIIEIKEQLEKINLHNNRNMSSNMQSKIIINHQRTSSVKNLRINMKNAIEAYKKVSPDSKYNDRNLSYELQKKNYR